MAQWWNYDGASLWGPTVANNTASLTQRADEEANRQRQVAVAESKTNEAITRAQFESDREYELEAKKLQQEADRIALTHGQNEANEWYQRQTIKLAKKKFSEETRQFDLNFGEGQRQFNVGQSGYLDGRPTLAREQFFDSSLFNWTKQAIDLASRPQDWVKYKQYTSGVGNNIGSIPGLSWTTGGQVGNTTAQGDHPTNSLSNIFSNMGVGGGGGGGTWADSAAQQAQQIASTPPNLSAQEKQLYQTANEFAANPQGAAPGWYENLDPMTRDLLQGAGEAQGHDWSTALSRYRRSRWGGGGSAQAA